MGHSVGHWENDTLVVDVTGFNGKNWFTELEFSQRFAAPDGALHSDQPRCHSIRSHDRRSRNIHAPMANFDAALTDASSRRSAHRISLYRFCRRIFVWKCS